MILPEVNPVVEREDSPFAADVPSPLSNSRSPASPHASSTCGSQYILVCQARAASLSEGAWSFTLETADGDPVLAADDVDLGDLNRLTLLAAVRGLESIDGPASVLMLSNNRYLIRSLAESLPRWRENQFVWEHFGRRIDVQHADLWRRIDRALQIHRVQACLISSRLVSQGSLSGGSVGSSDRWLRVDTPHHDSLHHDSLRHDSPDRDSRKSGVVVSRGGRQPGDGLRRWLLSGEASQGGQAPRHRFTSADLLESA